MRAAWLSRFRGLGIEGASFYKFREIIPIMANEMDEKMENEMEASGR